MKTDADGRFELRTILPGSYPGMHVPAHIHFSLWGAGYPLQWVDELRFEGDHYITPAMRSEDANKEPSRTIRRLSGETMAFFVAAITSGFIAEVISGSM